MERNLFREPAFQEALRNPRRHILLRIKPAKPETSKHRESLYRLLRSLQWLSLLRGQRPPFFSTGRTGRTTTLRLRLRLVRYCRLLPGKLCARQPGMAGRLMLTGQAQCGRATPSVPEGIRSLLAAALSKAPKIHTCFPPAGKAT